MPIEQLCMLFKTEINDLHSEGLHVWKSIYTLLLTIENVVVQQKIEKVFMIKFINTANLFQLCNSWGHYFFLVQKLDNLFDITWLFEAQMIVIQTKVTFHRNNENLLFNKVAFFIILGIFLFDDNDRWVDDKWINIK